MTTKTKLTYDEFTNNLEQHIGSTKFYHLNLTSIIATEGIKYFADTCECYWLFDEICHETMLLWLKNKNPEQYNCLFAEIEVNKRHTVHITVREDRDLPIVIDKKIHDVCELIPVGKYMVYLINNTLLLPSEY